ncbi:CRISPR-associated protein Csx19 [uncultured Mitsuokella sp.]|uniref:type III-D CRISPR-associated protein Csx19 n=1 Tax=uncultured Mitsuokella sp. TaxID=453120 RepID=UPI002617EFBF|nr:CRISPR-associated protein Csx19 [uncultured Mitsuokella sp.]
MKEELLTIETGQVRHKQLCADVEDSRIYEILAENGLTEGTVVIWQVNKIRWGTFRDGHITFADGKPEQTALWLEGRFFNEKGEAHLTREKSFIKTQLFSIRVLLDGEGESCEHVDTLSRFWGECKAQDADWITLRDDDRKLEQIVPAVADQARFYGLVTRSYIGYDAVTAQAGYQDYRYVRIASADQKGEI